MRTRRILILYGTRYGHTAKIAEHMRATLASNGLEVAVANADAPRSVIEPEDYDGILIGGSLIGGRHQRSIKRYVMRHIERLNAMPSAFFSVSGSAASEDPVARADARVVMQRFLTETRWDPDMMTPIAGAIRYTKYPFFTRWVMREICRRNGGPTDTSKDHEMTDWAAVSEFAKRFSLIVAPAPAPGVLANR
jgi:menaquinone-dependent protoporphyrinogen oxidase